MNLSDELFSDDAVGALIGLARSANVYFDLVNGRVTLRAVQPRWQMWQPVRFLLDEVGAKRIEAYLARAGAAAAGGSDKGGAASVTPEAMLRWSRAMQSRQTFQAS